MNFRIITIPFDKNKEGFNYEELNEFVLNKENVKFNVEFFQSDQKSYWSVLLIYDKVIGIDSDIKFKHQYENVMYEELRKWRKERAEQDGVPPYIIFTNKQLRNLVINKCRTLEAMKNIEGIGEKKSELYSVDVFKIIKAYLENDNND